MMNRLLAALLFALLPLAAPAANADDGDGADAGAVLKRAASAMGADALRTLHYYGKGSAWAFGQAFEPGKAWPKQNLSSYARSIDYSTSALREETARSRAEPTGGSALPHTGELRAIQYVAGRHAWNGTGPGAAAVPFAAAARAHDLWTTPHGALKAAAQGHATVRWVREGKRELAAVSFGVPGTMEAVAYLDDAFLVERIESRLPNPVLGDTRVVTRFEGYREHGAIRFPSRIRQEMGGHPVLDLEVLEVQPNARVEIEAPVAVIEAAQRVASQVVSKGVWMVGGGSHNSVLVEMKDHLVLLEAPLGDERTGAVLQAAQFLVPSKPVRTVVVTHAHFDHAGGLRAAAAAGAEILAHREAAPFLARALANPNTIAPDRLAASGRKAKVTAVGDRHVLSDGERSIELHLIRDSRHAKGFLMAYLPKAWLLVEADAYTPVPGPAPATPNPNHVNLVENLDRLKLHVERILPLHGRPVPREELDRAVGRTR